MAGTSTRTDDPPTGLSGVLFDRYANRLALSLGAAGLAIVVYGVIAYVEVVAPIEDPGVRATVLSGYVGMVLTAFISLALIGVTTGSNTAIRLRLLSRKAERMRDGDMDVNLETERGDELGDLTRSLASMRDTLDRRLDEVERRRRETERLNREMQATAEHYRDVLQDVVDGDLSRRVDTTSDNEALESIGESINTTVAELESATANISSQMGSLSANSEEVAAAANELADTSEEAARTGQSGREAAERAIEEMSDVESEAEAAVEEIERLRAEMREIEDIVGLITEIARRTNILAVNARIESSRGEATGQGYSVVADEIRDLAEEAQEAAADIESRIEGLRDQTEETAGDITTTRERADAAADTVQDAMAAFDELVDYVEDVDRNVQNIDRATDDQAESVQSVAGMVERLSSTGAGTEDLAEPPSIDEVADTSAVADLGDAGEPDELGFERVEE